MQKTKIPFNLTHLIELSCRQSPYQHNFKMVIELFCWLPFFYSILLPYILPSTSTSWCNVNLERREKFTLVAVGDTFRRHYYSDEKFLSEHLEILMRARCCNKSGYMGYTNLIKITFRSSNYDIYLFSVGHIIIYIYTPWWFYEDFQIILDP